MFNNLTRITFWVLFNMIAAPVRCEVMDDCNNLSRCISNTGENVAGLPESAKKIAEFCKSNDKLKNCIRTWSQNCLHKQQQTAIQMQIKNQEVFTNLLCDNDDYQKEYLKYSSCYKSIANDWEACAYNFQKQLMNTKVEHSRHDLCCYWYNFNKCALSTSNLNCEEKANVMLRRILNTIYNGSLQANICSNVNVTVVCNGDTKRTAVNIVMLTLISYIIILIC